MAAKGAGKIVMNLVRIHRPDEIAPVIEVGDLVHPGTARISVFAFSISELM